MIEPTSKSRTTRPLPTPLNATIELVRRCDFARLHPEAIERLRRELEPQPREVEYA